jgi:hypothetical protein
MIEGTVIGRAAAVGNSAALEARSLARAIVRLPAICLLLTLHLEESYLTELQELLGTGDVCRPWSDSIRPNTRRPWEGMLVPKGSKNAR